MMLLSFLKSNKIIYKLIIIIYTHFLVASILSKQTKDKLILNLKSINDKTNLNNNKKDIYNELLNSKIIHANLKCEKSLDCLTFLNQYSNPNVLESELNKILSNMCFVLGLNKQVKSIGNLDNIEKKKYVSNIIYTYLTSTEFDCNNDKLIIFQLLLNDNFDVFIKCLINYYNTKILIISNLKAYYKEEIKIKLDYSYKNSIQNFYMLYNLVNIVNYKLKQHSKQINLENYYYHQELNSNSVFLKLKHSAKNKYVISSIPLIFSYYKDISEFNNKVLNNLNTYHLVVEIENSNCKGDHVDKNKNNRKIYVKPFTIYIILNVHTDKNIIYLKCNCINDDINILEGDNSNIIKGFEDIVKSYKFGHNQNNKLFNDSVISFKNTNKFIRDDTNIKKKNTNISNKILKKNANKNPMFIDFESDNESNNESNYNPFKDNSIVSNNSEEGFKFNDFEDNISNESNEGYSFNDFEDSL